MSRSRSLVLLLPGERRLVPCRRVSQSAVILTWSCVPAGLRDFKTGLSPGRYCPEAAACSGVPCLPWATSTGWRGTQHGPPGVGVGFRLVLLQAGFGLVLTRGIRCHTRGTETLPGAGKQAWLRAASGCVRCH